MSDREQIRRDAPKESDWIRVEEALNRFSFVSGEPDYSLAESAKEALFRMGSALEQAERDRDRLAAALRELGSPNYAARATGQDARDMAVYARESLKAQEEK